MKISLLFLSAALTTVCVISVNASDHSNLEENLPTQLEDAYPIEYGGREIQSYATYVHDREGHDLFQLGPSLEFGFAPNWQGKILIPFEFGKGEQALQDVAIETLYNFNTDGVWLPAFALSARGDLPTGPESSGVDPTLKFIATKGLGRTSFFNQLHLNVAWTHNTDARADERENRFLAVVGWSARIDADTIGIIDYVHQQEREKGIASDIIELGVRRQMTPLLTVSAGLGAGLNDDSPDFRGTLGIQKSF